MNYEDYIKVSTEKNGAEETLKNVARRIEELLSVVKDSAPDAYRTFHRNMYEDTFGGHYNAEYGYLDVAKLEYTDHGGCRRSGAHWSISDIARMTAGMTFPEGTTQYDRYVAFNVAYSMLCQKYRDEEIIQIGYMMFFSDNGCNVWQWVKIKGDR